MFLLDAEFHMAALTTIINNNASKTTALERKLAETQEALAESQRESCQLKNQVHLIKQLLIDESLKVEKIQKKNDSLAFEKEKLADSTSKLSLKLGMLQNKFNTESKR